MCVLLAGDGGTLFYFPLKQFPHSQGILMHWVIYGTINLKNQPVEYGSFFQNIWIGRKEYISDFFLRPSDRFSLNSLLLAFGSIRNVNQ